MCAKSKSFFGLRRGSTKSLTFQVLDGQQITKDRVTEVRNPRTEKQRIQRVIMNTALRAYSAMKSICDHSFEGIIYGGKSQQAFLAENIRAARTRLAGMGESFAKEKAFTPLGMNFVSPNAYVISKGSLYTVPYMMGNGLEVPAGATYASLIAACRAKAGDQLTFCALVSDGNPINNRFVFSRVILQPQDESGNNLPLDTPLVVDGAINAPNFRNENTDSFSWAIVEDKLVVNHVGDPIIAAGIIASRLVNGAWLRSSQSMVFASPKQGYTLAEALDTSIAQIDVLDDRYLNNAGDQPSVPSAGVSSITYANEAVAEGGEYAAGGTLKFVGNKLSNTNIVVWAEKDGGAGNVTYAPATSSDTEVTYILSSAAKIHVLINGENYVNFSVLPLEVVVPISTMRFGSSGSIALGSNTTVAMGHVYQLDMKTSTGFDASLVAASNSNIVMDKKSTPTSGYNATWTVTTNGAGVITYNGIVILALNMQDDDYVQPLG